MKNTEESAAELRDSALTCLGVFKGRVPELMEVHLSSFTPIKMEKINEKAKTIQPSKFDKPEPKKIQMPKATTQQKKKLPIKKKDTPPQTSEQEDEKMEDLTGDKQPAFGNDDLPIGKSSGMGTSMADAYPPGMSEDDFAKNSLEEKPIGKSTGPGSSMADAYPPGMSEEDVVA